MMSSPSSATAAPIRVLLIEGDAAYALMLGETAAATAPDIRMDWTPTLAAGSRRLEIGGTDLVLVDVTLSDSQGIDTVRRLRQAAPDLPVVVLTALGSTELTLAAMREHADNVLVKTETDPDGVLRAVRCAVARQRHNGALGEQLRVLRADHENLRRLVDACPDEMLIVDQDGAILMLNAAAARMVGQPAERLLGRPFGRPVVAGESVEVRIGERICDLRAEQTLWKNAPAFAVSLRDVTRRKHVEDQLRATAAELGEANQRLNELANEDPLTGLLNRRGMDAALRREIEGLRRGGRSLSAVVVDCDRFKRVNDRLGYAAGDLVLQEVARRLSATRRPTDSLSRVGGDEFLLLLPDTRLAEAVQVAERLRMSVSECPISCGGSQSLKMTVSVGVAPINGQVGSVAEILPITELALKKAKAGGKNRISSTGAHPVVDSDAVIDIAANLERYLLADDFLHAVSQPIVGLDDQHAVGREFLVRGPTGSFEQPEDLFRLCRDRDLLTMADLAALRTCVSAASNTAIPGEVLHFNVFPSTLMDSSAERVLEIFPQPVPRGRYCLELSEQQFVGDPSYLRAPVMALKQAGILVALDDVGLGGAVLEGLLALEPDVVKLDRRRVNGHVSREGGGYEAGRSRRLQRLVRLVGFSGAQVIAEGIETADDVRVVAAAGIARGQGYHFGSPQ